MVTAVHGGGAEGVKDYVERLSAELKDPMAVCGVFSLDEVDSEVL